MQHVLSGAISSDGNRESLPSYDRTQELIAMIEARYRDRIATLVETWAMQLQTAMDLMPHAPAEPIEILHTVQQAMTAVTRSDLPEPIKWEPEVHDVEFEGVPVVQLKAVSSSVLDRQDNSLPKDEPHCVQLANDASDSMIRRHRPCSSSVRLPSWSNRLLGEGLWIVSGCLATAMVAIVMLLVVSRGQPPHNTIPDPQFQRLH
jgi:hypothetical protein